MNAHVGLTVGTLKNLASAAKTWPPDTRNAELTISHHIALLGVEEERRDYLLSEAQANGMSVGRLRAIAHYSHDEMTLHHRGNFATEVEAVDEWVNAPLKTNQLGSYRVRGELKRCEAHGHLWAAPLDYCPYCHLSPEVRQYHAALDSGEMVPFASPFMYQDDEPADKPHVAHNSGNNEWYTPSEYIEAARQVMGGIDLDPASSYKANEVIGAETIYTADDDGLAHPWFGRVWMNPPYADSLIERFTSKLADHYRAGDVEEAIALVNNATETSWFHHLITVASAVVFPRRRVRFYRPDGTLGDPLQGQAIIYMGKQAQRFKSAYHPFGWRAAVEQ